MNFFKRFTSFFFCCVLLSSFFVVPVSAVDDSDYYSLPPVGASELSLSVSYPVNPSATGDGWTDSDRNLLQAIKNALTDISSGSINWYLTWIYDSLRGGDIPGDLGKIQQNTLSVASRILDSNSLLGSINTAVSGFNGFATEASLSKLVTTFSSARYDIGPKYGDFGELINSAFGAYSQWYTTTGDMRGGLNSAISAISVGLTTDSLNLFGDDKTLYHYVKNLSQTLASEDDKQLAENQKENREQAEQDFLSGKSDKTSLGKEDFGSLSGVGGTFKDITSLNGQASIGSFTDGLSSANETGQGWFSQATKDALDSVSESSSNVSTFSVDGDYMEDADIYNMAGFEDHYLWLWGDK